MSKPKHLTAPLPIDTMPSGIPYIICNEAAERFCYYGMVSVLILYMTKRLLGADGSLATMSPEGARECFSWFTAGVYFFPILGAILADAVLGKFWTIFSLSLVYCLGTFVLAADQTRVGLFAGLFLITLGAGGIKSNVSANVGDQFGPKNRHLLERVFSWFYFSINVGSLFAALLIPLLLEYFGNPEHFGERAKHLGPMVAFGVPGLLMIVAITAFWMGRKKFVHIPPAGSAMLKEACSREGLGVMAKLAGLYMFIAVFWSLYGQSMSAWILQADKLDRHLLTWLQPVEAWAVGAGLTGVKGLSQIEMLAGQVQSVNALLILVLIPVFTYWVYPAVGKVVRLTPLRKIGAGLFLTVLAFAVVAYTEQLISVSPTQPPSIWWLALSYAILTVAELMVSITCLEFSYTQAPKKMKSLIMSMYLLSNAAGNVFTALVNRFIRNENGTIKLPGASYYGFFAGLMFVAAVLFCVYACFYREKTYIQDSAEPTT
ncbi:MAG: POT family MFS transporter [Thermoguttaceae bacterium]